MTREEIRLECLRLALECREAGQGAAETIALAAALEAYVTTSARRAPAPRKSGRAA